MFSSEQDEYDYLFKIVLIGDSSVGKSSILRTFATGFSDISDMKSTIGVEFSTKSIIIKDTTIKMQIWDTAGQERYRAITAAYYRGALGSFLVFDLSNRESFTNLERWLEEIKNNADKHIVIMVIGNKSDKSADRRVSMKEAMTFCEQRGLIYIETSALNREGIDRAFENIADTIFQTVIVPREDIKIAISNIVPSSTIKIEPVYTAKNSKKKCC